MKRLVMVLVLVTVAAPFLGPISQSQATTMNVEIESVVIADEGG